MRFIYRKSNMIITGLLLVSLILSGVSLAAETTGSSQSNQISGKGWMTWDKSNWPTEPVRGGEFRVASPVYIGLMNPNHFPVMDWVTIGSFYERLILNDAKYMPTIPWLAESWHYEDDVTLLMKLRQGVKFHDGTEFNADTVKQQIEWILNPVNKAWTRTWFKPLKSVEIVDEYTVRWHLKHQWGAFLGTLASVPGYMISQTALKKDQALAETKYLKRKWISARRKAKNGDKEAQAEFSSLTARMAELSTLTENAKSLDQVPVGTGPFMLKKAVPGNYVELIRNPDWWFGRYVNKPDMPYFDAIKVSTIPDPSVRLANLRANTLDFVNLSAPQYRVIKNNKQFDSAVYPLNWTISLMFNHARGVCQDIRVREAISHAIDRQALVQGTQFGLGRVASCMYPDDHWAHNPDLKPVTYDPELSKKLLAEAGYHNGLTLKGFIFNSPESQAFGKAIMAMLEKVGITWKPASLGIAAMMEPFQKLDFDMIGMLFPWIVEPDHMATLLYDPDSPFNNGRSHNEKAMALIEAGRNESDMEKRKQIYHKLEAALYENYEDVWLWYPSIVFASNKNLQGINFDLYRQYGEAYYFSHPAWFKNGRN